MDGRSDDDDDDDDDYEDELTWTSVERLWTPRLRLRRNH